MELAPKMRDVIGVAEVVLGTNHVVLLANGFPRLIVYMHPPYLFLEQVAEHPF